MKRNDLQVFREGFSGRLPRRDERGEECLLLHPVGICLHGVMGYLAFLVPNAWRGRLALLRATLVRSAFVPLSFSVRLGESTPYFRSNAIR
jgi:hypothetical protein